MKKIISVVVLVLLVIGLLTSKYEEPMYAQENLMMHESNSEDVADEQVENMNISKDYIENFGDFTSNYVKDTYFEIQVGDKYFYNQGYYITITDTGQKVFCIEPDIMIGQIEDKTLSQGKYSELTPDVQASISDYITAGLKAYEKSSDEEYLVATQVLVWEEVGATTLSLSDNISQKEDELEELSSSLRDNLNTIDSSDEDIETASLSSGVTSETTYSDIYEEAADTMNLSEEVLEDSQDYTAQVEQYVTEGQDVVTVSEDNSFSVVQEVADEDGDDVVYPGETLEYTVRIENDMQESTDFLISEEDYNKYLSVTENDEINVSGESYNVEDLVSSNFVIEDVEAGEDIEFSFEVQADENYDGELIKNEIEVCNTLDDGCVSSETKIMGNVVEEEVSEAKQNPYAKIKEKDVDTDKIEVKVTGADVSDLMQGDADVNLYLGDELIDSQSISLDSSESENTIIFEDCEDYDIISNTKYEIEVYGKYEDSTTGKDIEGVLNDGTAQNVEAKIEVKTEKSGDEPEIGDIRVSSTLKELTSSSVKFEMGIDNPTQDAIDNGKIVFADESQELELVLTNDNIDDLMDGDTITLLEDTLTAETKYDVSYEFYDRSDDLVGRGELGEIETDTLAPILSLDSTGNVVDSAVQTATGKVVINNKQSIINSEEKKVYITLTEYDGSGANIREEVQEFDVDDTVNDITYNFSNINTSNSYEIKVSTKYNVDMMFDKDADEGTYEEVLISFDGSGSILYSALTAVYDMGSAIIDSSSITISFTIQNPESKIIDDTNMTVKACKTPELTSCSSPVVATSNSGIYTVTITGLESDSEYKLIANAPIADNVGDTPTNQDIQGATSTDIFSTGTVSALDPPIAYYNPVQVENNILDIGGTSSVEVDFTVVDNNTMLDSTKLPEVYVYTDVNEDGVYDLGDDTLIDQADVIPKSGWFVEDNEYTATLEGLDRRQSYQFYTKCVYSGASTYTPIQSVDNTFDTDILSETYVEYNQDNTTIYNTSLSTEFTLIDDERKAQSIGEVSVYTDLNQNGIVDELDSEVAVDTNITPTNNLTYKVDVSGLKPNTSYQLHNDISSVEDSRVYEVDSIDNVFRTQKEDKPQDSSYNLYVEPQSNVIDSYTANTARIEVSIASDLKLDDIQSIDMKLVNKNDLLDTHVISLTNNQVQSLKNDEPVDLYVSDLTEASEYIIYAILDTKDEEKILESENNIYTDYEEPEINVTNKQENEDSVSMEINVEDSNSYLENIKVVNNTLNTSQDISLIGNKAEVEFDDLEPNEDYEFSIIYDYLIDNQNYLSTRSNTSEIIFTLETEENNKISIETCQELQDIQSNLVGSYELEQDIDCQGQLFTPITAFGGELDGRGYSINNLEIKQPQSDYVGLVSNNSGTIENITLNNSSIAGNTYVGSIAGINTGTIRNINSDAQIKALDYVGSIAGENKGTILDVIYTGEIESDGNNIDLVQEDEISNSTDEDQIEDDIVSNDNTNSNDTEDEDYVSNILGIDDSDEQTEDNLQEDKTTTEEAKEEENDTKDSFNLYDYIKGLIEN